MTADEETFTVTLEFEPPVTSEDLRERFQALADRLVDDTGPETTLIVSPASGPARRIRVVRSDVPGTPFTLQEFEWTGCAWRPTGREPLVSVEVDGVRYDAGDGIGGAYAGP